MKTFKMILVQVIPILSEHDYPNDLRTRLSPMSKITYSKK